MLRLPGELRDMFREWLQANYPDRLKHAVSLMQSMREGKDYEAQWGKRMAGSGPYAWMIGRRFEMATRRLGYREIIAPAAHGPVREARARGARNGRAAQPVLRRSVETHHEGHKGTRRSLCSFVIFVVKKAPCHLIARPSAAAPRG